MRNGAFPGQTGLLRLLTLTFAVAVCLTAGLFFIDLIGGNRPVFLDWVRTILLVVTGFWLVWGGTTVIIGALPPAPKPRGDQRRP